VQKGEEPGQLQNCLDVPIMQLWPMMKRNDNNKTVSNNSCPTSATSRLANRNRKIKYKLQGKEYKNGECQVSMNVVHFSFAP